MKKFCDGGEYFTFSSFRITSIPVSKDEETEDLGARAARTLLEDACYLSSDGNGQAAIELLRITGKSIGSPIEHILSFRTHDGSDQDCVVRHEALVWGAQSVLHHNGYVFEELPYSISIYASKR